MLSKKSILLVTLSTTIGIVVGVLFSHLNQKKLATSSSSFRLGYSKWTNPLLDCTYSENNQPPKIGQMKREVEALLGQFRQNNPESSAAIFFQELDSGAWFGINQEQKFAAASLSKVPLLAKIYQMAESDPQLLKKAFVFEPQAHSFANIESNAPKEVSLKAGESYSVNQLIENMIIYSDNIATVVLVDKLKIDIGRLFHELGIVYSRSDGLLQLTAKSYAAVFRILYNSTFISRPMSERALALLARSDFDKGIRASVPTGVRVANKFGARTLDKKGFYQLHDCGIIYSSKPYLLCVMTKGKKLPLMGQFIRQVSQACIKINQP